MAHDFLREYLNDPARPAGTLRYHELQGFLFAVACAPEMVQPSEWLPIVHGDQEPEYDNLDRANAVLQAVMALYNEIAATARGEHPALPEDCALREDPLANLEPDAPAGQWSRGFLTGHDWLTNLWEPYIPEEIDDEFGATLMALTCLASKALAEEFCSELGSDLPSMAADVCRLFPDALVEYAGLGRTLEQALGGAAVEPRRVVKVGRNDPCPCGSGRKYKKCCETTSH